jgi:signal transduction histidine kinase/ligand-binding sensor domain-containing protein
MSLHFFSKKSPPSIINKYLLIILYFVVFYIESASQTVSNLDPQKRLSQYILKNWNTEDGLTSESTNDVMQSEDGYIWIATYTGLHRFDGKEFTVFTSENSRLPSSNILKIDTDSKGTIWLGTLKGMAIYKHGTVSIPANLEQIKNVIIEDILVADNDDVWISSKSNELFLFKDNELINFTQELKRKSTILTIGQGINGTILFGTDDSKLYSYSTKEGLVQLAFNLEVNGINDITTIGNTTYISTGTGLFTMTESGFDKQTYLSDAAINSLQPDGDDILWMGTNQGLYRYQFKLNKLDSLTENHGLPNNLIRDLIIDKEGNLWGGTYRSGVFFLTNGSITSLSTNDGLQSNIICGITELSESNYLIGNESGFLNQLKNGKISEYHPEVPIPNARLKNLFTDSQNRVWVSTYAGLVLLDGNNSRIYNTKNGFPDNFIRLVFEDNEGSIWVGTKNAGLIKFKSLDSWDVINISNGMSSDYIMSIIQNENNDLIVGTISGVNIINDMNVVKQITTKDGLPSNFSFSIYPTSKYLWMATNDGLVGYSEKKVVVFTIENGLPFNIIYDVFADKNGNLWMPGEKAVLKVNLAELEASADRVNGRIEVELFDRTNGMKNSHCLGGVLSYTDSQGSFWIPTQDGVAFIKPSNLDAPDLDPKPIIETVYADNQSIPIDRVVSVPALTDRLLIDFTDISFKYSEKLQFRYKLEPFDKDWISSSLERNALYTNLSPGNYEFKLQTGINDTFLVPISIQKIRIEASWYQTIWAKILLIIIILSIGLLIYWIRVKTLTRRNLKLEEMVGTRTEELKAQKEELTVALERLSNTKEKMVQSEKMASLGILSAGIAHEINNPLNFINGGVVALEQILGDLKGDELKDVPKLLSIIKEGVTRASKIVSSLNQFSHSREDVKEACNIHNILENCLVMTKHHFMDKVEVKKFFTKETPMVLGNNGKLHQVFLNIITNAAQAIHDKGTIQISTEVIKKKLEITFEDSGEGISKKDLKRIMEPFYSTKAAGKGTGLGLSITYAIIEEHKGTLNFDSELGKGTIATITLPIMEA